MRSLSGTWIGHYEQRGMKSRIKALLRQEGETITGEMTDLEVESVMTLSDYTAGLGMPPGTDEEMARQIRAALPDAPKGEIHVRSVLPPSSTISGKRSGASVRFVKTYQGPCLHPLEIGNQALEQSAHGHSIDYMGRISEDETRITGRWHIAGAPGFTNEGDFELTREG